MSGVSEERIDEMEELIGKRRLEVAEACRKAGIPADAACCVAMVELAADLHRHLGLSRSVWMKLCEIAGRDGSHE